MRRAFQHFVITRFNIKSKAWQTDKNHQPVNDAGWLQNRIALFEAFCLPSMSIQSTKNFNWFVFFDSSPTELLTEKINEWEIVCENFYPVYVDDYEEFITHDIEQTIRKHVRNDVKFIITTRIDNDDAFHKNALQVIQDNFSPNHMQIIDLLNGYCLDINKQIMLKRSYESNPFISLIEAINDTSKIHSVMREGHPAWIGMTDFTSVITEPLWIQVIHEKNVSNTLKGKTVFSLEPLAQFNVKNTFKKPYFSHAINYAFKHSYFEFKHRLKMFVKQILSGNGNKK